MEWISDKIFNFFDYENGFFIECGANDGITQSNTYRLEKEKNWSGILIEPSLVSFNQCIKNRSKKNIFENCVLVSDSYNSESILGDFDGNLMSSVGGNRRNNKNILEVPAKKLSNILTNYNIDKIDFFSLDVEGYEFEVLKGLDFKTHAPYFILIEIYNKDYEKIVNLLTEYGYKLICNLSNFNKENNPYWDGTHNDYLFEKK